jgi:hypothetical protein
MPNIIDLTGKRFGRLVVQERVLCGEHVTWLCKCDCGGTKIVRGQSLRQGRCKSCGCLHKESTRPNKLASGEAAMNILYSRYRRDASNRGYAWSLSKDCFESVTKKNCYYCGVPPSSVFTRVALNGEYVYNGIDRIDNSLGYTEENVVPCCSTCNRMKSDMSKDSFLSHVEKISNFKGT